VGRDSYYDILGVSYASPPDEIRAKYRKLIQRIHPDLDGPAALFRQVQEAYEVLSDPVRRAAYDRSLEAGDQRLSGGRKASPSRERASHQTHAQSGSGPARSGPTRPRHASTPHVPSQDTSRKDNVHSFLRQYPARVAAIAGAGLLAFGAALGPIGRGLLLLGVVALILACVAGLGGRGAKECEAYQRSGMAAVDAMTGRQFKALLEHFFATKGYRVARLGARGDFGADLLLYDPHGRTIVQVKRWTGLVRHDAVQRAVDAKAHYGVARALVVTSSNYSQEAVMAANSNGVTLWNRAALAAELSAFRGGALQFGVKRFSADLRAGTRMCLGIVATLFVALLVASTKVRRRDPVK
jgi:restriction system protein